MNNELDCLLCRHDWHGLPCTATRWVQGSNRPTTCGCRTSIPTGSHIVWNHTETETP